MPASQWTYRSAAEMAEALDAKQVSAVELAEASIARIEACEPRLNAVCVRDFAAAREAARKADARLAGLDPRDGSLREFDGGDLLSVERVGHFCGAAVGPL